MSRLMRWLVGRAFRGSRRGLVVSLALLTTLCYFAAWHFLSGPTATTQAVHRRSVTPAPITEDEFLGALRATVLSLRKLRSRIQATNPQQLEVTSTCMTTPTATEQPLTILHPRVCIRQNGFLLFLIYSKAANLKHRQIIRETYGSLAYVFNTDRPLHVDHLFIVTGPRASAQLDEAQAFRDLLHFDHENETLAFQFGLDHVFANCYPKTLRYVALGHDSMFFNVPELVAYLEKQEYQNGQSRRENHALRTPLFCSKHEIKATQLTANQKKEATRTTKDAKAKTTPACNMPLGGMVASLATFRNLFRFCESTAGKNGNIVTSQLMFDEFVSVNLAAKAAVKLVDFASRRTVEDRTILPSNANPDKNPIPPHLVYIKGDLIPKFIWKVLFRTTLQNFYAKHV